MRKCNYKAYLSAVLIKTENRKNSDDDHFGATDIHCCVNDHEICTIYIWIEKSFSDLIENSLLSVRIMQCYLIWP